MNYTILLDIVTILLLIIIFCLIYYRKSVIYKINSIPTQGTWKIQPIRKSRLYRQICCVLLFVSGNEQFLRPDLQQCQIKKPTTAPLLASVPHSMYRMTFRFFHSSDYAQPYQGLWQGLKRWFFWFIVLSP